MCVWHVVRDSSVPIIANLLLSSSMRTKHTFVCKRGEQKAIWLNTVQRVRQEGHRWAIGVQIHHVELAMSVLIVRQKLIQFRVFNLKSGARNIVLDKIVPHGLSSCERHVVCSQTTNFWDFLEVTDSAETRRWKALQHCQRLSLGEGFQSENGKVTVELLNRVVEDTAILGNFGASFANSLH